MDVSDYEIYEVATSDGVKRLRYPRLDGPKVTSLAKQLADVRNRTLAAMSVNDILDIVADAAQLWADPDFELRRQAELLIPAITGYEPDMVRIELKRYMRQFSVVNCSGSLTPKSVSRLCLTNSGRTRRGIL